MKHKNMLLVILLFLSSCTRDINSFTQTPTLTPTPFLQTDEDTLSNDCQVTIEQTLPDIKDAGKIILSGYVGYSGESFSDSSYLFDMNTGKLTPLPQEPGKYIYSISYIVSPDRSHLAYVQENDNYIDMNLPRDPYLYIISSNGVEEKEYKINISSAFEWLDENRIILEQSVPGSNSFSSPSVSNIESVPLSFSWFLLNLATGEIEELRSNFPDQDFIGVMVHFPASRAIYNSLLDRVVYPTSLPNAVIRLYDVTTGRVINDVPTTDFGKLYTWSVDGKSIAFATTIGKNGRNVDEILVMDKNGVLSQLVTLPSELEYDSEITGLSWSPDSDQIAYWVNDYTEQMPLSKSHLSIARVITKESRRFCDFTIPGERYFSNWEGPIWSPDGKYLLVTLTNYANEQNTIVVIIDVVTGKMYRIGNDFRAVGWLK
jgi:hypothetical protein